MVFCNLLPGCFQVRIRPTPAAASLPQPADLITSLQFMAMADVRCARIDTLCSFNASALPNRTVFYLDPQQMVRCGRVSKVKRLCVSVLNLCRILIEEPAPGAGLPGGRGEVLYTRFWQAVPGRECSGTHIRAFHRSSLQDLPSFSRLTS